MDDAKLAARLEALESRGAIERLLHEYALGFDTRDREMFRGIWFEDSTLDMGEIGCFVGLDAVMACAEKSWAELSNSNHWMSNALIDLDGDRATAKSALDCFVIHGTDGPVHAAGVYADECERRDGRWGIVKRTLELSFWTPQGAQWKPTSGTVLAA